MEKFESSTMAADADRSHLRFADEHTSTGDAPAPAHWISEATACFQSLDSNRWLLRTEVQAEVQRHFCEANEGKPGAIPFSLSVQGKENLARGVEDILRDWEKYLRLKFPGFSSYDATVGEHDGAEQEKHTRVVGPSEAHWKSFLERYTWFRGVLAEVEDFVRSNVETNNAMARKRRAQKRAKRTDDDTTGLASELEADRLHDAEAEEEPCVLHDMHILQQVSSTTEGGGAAFDDHQDLHAEVQTGKKLRWTVTLLVHSEGPPTGFFMWNSRSRPSGDASGNGAVCGVLPYAAPGDGVLFPSMAWHRSVLPARSRWPFEAVKFSFFFAAPTDRSRRYHRARLERDSKTLGAPAMSHLGPEAAEQTAASNLATAARESECRAVNISLPGSGQCKAHGGGPRCNEPGCEKRSQGASGQCKAHGGGPRCNEPGCKKSSQGASGKCIAHGGGRRCDEPGCEKSSQGASGKCIAHGGGRRCDEPGCNKSSQGASGKCIAHGGGRRCDEPGCETMIKGASGKCTVHGGGPRCNEPGCEKTTRCSSGKCFAHGGGRRCGEQGCEKRSQGKSGRCTTHGGGRRCDEPGCEKLSQLGGQCIAHGGGRRCNEPGCEKSSQGASGKCFAHDGGRRCNEPGCEKTTRCSSGKCFAHGGSSRRCDEPGCEKRSQGKSGKCTTHGGGRRCDEPGCEKFSQLGGQCIAHGGGRRCDEPGCEKSSQGASGKCTVHGGGRRCNEPGCNKLSKGIGGKCTTHGGGRRNMRRQEAKKHKKSISSNSDDRAYSEGGNHAAEEKGKGKKKKKPTKAESSSSDDSSSDSSFEDKEDERATGKRTEEYRFRLNRSVLV